MPQPTPFTRDQLKAYEAPAFVPATKSAAGAVSEQTPDLQHEENTSADDSADSSTVDDTDATDLGDDGLEDGDTDSSTVTDADDDSTDSDSDTSNEGDKTRRGRARERIEDLLAQVKSMREYNSYRDGALETALGELKALKAASPNSDSTARKDVPLDKDDPIPKLEDFDFDPVKTDEARAQWLQREAKRLAKAELNNLTAQQEEQKVIQKFSSRAEELKKVHADFDTVLNNPAVPKLHGRAARELVKSDIGPDIAYYLAKNVDRAAKISRMDPDQQIKAIGKIESQLESEQERSKTQNTAAKASDGKTGTGKVPAKKTVTKAPPPPSHTPAGGTSGIQKDPMKMSMDEWVASERNRKIQDKQRNVKMRQAMRGR
jgi:hypothetical protein